MFIRTVTTAAKGKKYFKQRLVESYRTQEGKVRQRVIMDLGNIEKDIPKTQWKELSTLLEMRLSGQTAYISHSEILEKFADMLYATNVYSKSKSEITEQMVKERDYDTIDINSIQVSEARQIGPEIVAKSLWDELEFESLLRGFGFSENEISVSMALIIGRLINPGAEIETHRWFRTRTALIEMTPADISGIGKDIFYTTGDLLFENKNKIEANLYEKETTLFALERKVFLFDITNTYFEGNAKGSALARFGKSKENRSDCPLVSMALMVDGSGFPVFSRIYEGNVSEPKTLEEVIKDVKENTPSIALAAPTVFVMDRGIATKDNIEYLKRSGLGYVLIERTNIAKEYLDEFSALKNQIEDKSEAFKENGWETIRSPGRIEEGKDEEVPGRIKVYVKEAEANDGDSELTDEGDETTCGNTHVKRILTLSLGKESKELAIYERKAIRFKEEIQIIQKSLSHGKLMLAEKVNIRLGRLHQKYIGITNTYDVRVETLPDNPAIVKSITLSEKEANPSIEALAGTYVIETNQVHLSKTEVWELYTVLTKVESAFRDLKSELGFRPIFHRKDIRTEAHLFISMLAYHLLVAIEYRLSMKGDYRCWRTIRNILSTHQRTTVNCVNANGSVLSLRVSTVPEPQHLEIYQNLNVSDPLKRLKFYK